MQKKSNAYFLRYMAPIVESLQELGYSARPKQVCETVLEKIDVPDEELEDIQKSGQTRYYNNVHWARLYLVKAGFIDASKRGVWSLTPKGRDAEINESLKNSIFFQVQEQNAGSKSKPEISDEELDEIEEEIEDLEYRGETLERLKSMPPDAFERFCQALLLESGFEDVVVTGKSGDQGIDGQGTLRINPFVSIKVMFQSKRYKDSVSSPQIRDFRGAISGRADRGLFITTGKFTRDAENEASREGTTPIELVDGSDLLDLMEQFEFGLEPVKTFRPEPDFFDRFEN